ncbi:hypothetical protein QYZ87_06260 [Porphyromonadaceae bacterium W3.11]|nr:hypothetical protein [Porphyromonadaceae bacterium W3.11]
MSLDNKGVDDRLLKRIDDMIEELHLIRRSVADLLVAQADSEARASSCEASITSLEDLYRKDFGEKETSQKAEEFPFVSPEGFDKEPITVEDLPSEKSVSSIGGDVVSEDEPKEGEAESLDTFNELFHLAEPQGAINDIFVPLNDESSLDTIFEKSLSFDHLVDKFSLADRYFYANELFEGDQVAFDEALADIQRFSNWSQVESYVYDVIRLKRDNAIVKDFMAVIKNASH